MVHQYSIFNLQKEGRHSMKPGDTEDPNNRTPDGMTAAEDIA